MIGLLLGNEIFHLEMLVSISNACFSIQLEDCVDLLNCLGSKFNKLCSLLFTIILPPS